MSRWGLLRRGIFPLFQLREQQLEYEDLVFPKLGTFPRYRCLVEPFAAIVQSVLPAESFPP